MSNPINGSTWAIEKGMYQKIASEIESTAVVETKCNWYWSALYFIGVFFTFGFLLIGISHKKFMEEFATTLITRQGYPRSWIVLSVRVIIHECRHTTQAVWFGWIFFPIAWISRRFRAWLGLPLFALIYFVLPFPIFFAGGRFYLELDADKKVWRECLDRGIMFTDQIIDHAKFRAESLSSGAYFWAWPAPLARRSYNKAAESVIEDFTKNIVKNINLADKYRNEEQ